MTLRFPLGILLTLLLLLLTGCAETFTITRGSYPSDFDEANSQCLATVNHVHLRNGQIIDTDQLALAPDSATWILPDGRRQRVRLWDIQRIDLSNHRKGARDGAFAGLLVGIGGGLAIPWSPNGSLGKLAVDALTGATAAAGGIIGAIVGGAIGFPTVIKFDSAQAIPADTMRLPVRNSAGWDAPATSDSTHKR